MTGEPRLPRVEYPRLDRLFRVGEAIWERRPDVRAVHERIDSFGYWGWMTMDGAVEHAELQEALYPLPDAFLTERVVGSITREEFLTSGIVNAGRIQRCAAEAGFDFTAGGRILDFGCGCGRLLRVMARYADRFELFGVDVDPDAVAYCRSTLDFASAEAIGHAPPLPFEDGAFDLAYAYSILTHLTEAGCDAWIAELARVVRPGGLVVVTTAGRRMIERYLGGDADDPIPTPAQLKDAQPDLNERGFRFFPYRELECPDPRNVEFFAEWDLESYGMTFVLEPYVRERWLERFELAAHHEAPDDYQDFVVLRRTHSP